MNKNKSFLSCQLRSLIVVCCLFLSLFMVGCSDASKESSSDTDHIASTSDKQSSATDASLLGEFKAVTYTGESVDQTIFAQADVTMINVWTTFCTYCIDEMPALKSLSEKYRDQGFQVIGIVSDVAKSGDETVQDIIDATGADYTHIIPSSDLRTGFLKNVQSVPTTYFVDSEGKQIGNPYLGARNQDSWEKIITDILPNTQENDNEKE